MANDGESSHCKGMSLEQTHEMSIDNALNTRQEQVRKLIMELEHVKGSEHRAPHYWEFNHNPVAITYSCSHENHEE